MPTVLHFLWAILSTSTVLELVIWGNLMQKINSSKQRINPPWTKLYLSYSADYNSNGWRHSNHPEFGSEPSLEPHPTHCQAYWQAPPKHCHLYWQAPGSALLNSGVSLSVNSALYFLKCGSALLNSGVSMGTRT